ncbi:MAG: VTT domain-containing protein [Amnibacterium sp.]
MNGLEGWLLDSAGSPFVFLLVAVDLAISALLVVLPTQVLLVALSTLLLARGSGPPALLLLLVSALIGTWTGDAAVFVLARRAGLGHHPWFHRGRIGRVRAALRTRFTADPAGVLLAARFLPLGRLATVLLAAETGMRPRRYLRMSLVAAGVWALACIALGGVAGAWAAAQPLLVTALAVVASFGLVALVHLVDRRAAAWEGRRHSATARDRR